MADRQAHTTNTGGYKQTWQTQAYNKYQNMADTNTHNIPRISVHS